MPKGLRGPLLFRLVYSHALWWVVAPSLDLLALSRSMSRRSGRLLLLRHRPFTYARGTPSDIVRTTETDRRMSTWRRL